MARYRLSGPAVADLKEILAVSAERWGGYARRRYADLLTAAMQQAAADPAGRFVRHRNDLKRGLCSLHARHARVGGRRVKRPVHIVFFRVVAPGLILIVRILHERMDPSRHLSAHDEE